MAGRNIIIRIRDRKSGNFFYLSSDYRWTSIITLAWFMEEDDLGQVFRVFDGIQGVGADDVELPFDDPSDPELVRITLRQDILSSTEVKRLRKRKVLNSLSALDREALNMPDEGSFPTTTPPMMSDDQ